MIASDYYLFNGLSQCGSLYYFQLFFEIFENKNENFMLQPFEIRNMKRCKELFINMCHNRIRAKCTF